MGGQKIGIIVAAFAVAGIVAFLSGFIANTATTPRVLEEDAYPVEALEIVVADTSGEAKEGAEAVAKPAPVKKKKVAEPILAMLADADVARGQKVSKACAACHTFDQGGKNGVGPNLWNIVNRKKQSVAGFKYSGTLNSQGGEVWTYAELNKYLWKPKKYAPGTKMSYAGIKKTPDRAAVVAYLRTLAASPKALPTIAEMSAEAKELLPAAVTGAVDKRVDDAVKKALEDAASKN